MYRAYYLANRTLPEKIIIYRDGVGAGDIVRLMETEVTAVKV
jgi:aubergine-like protein